MFKWLTRRFTDHRSATDSSPFEPESLEDRRSDRITHPDKIDAILNDLRRHHLVLNVVVPGSNFPFVSSLLDIEGGMLLFDEFKPESGQQLVASKGRFKVEAVLRGIGISFTIDDFSIEDSGGIVLYRARFPREVSHQQRRKNHRIPIPPSQTVMFHGDHFGEGIRLNGTVANISREGLAFLTRLSIPLHAGDELVSCAFSLPSGDSVRFNLEICFVESLPWAKNSVIGGRFAALSAKDQHKLGDFLMVLERQLARAGSEEY
jgi:c-di-GMP-binding flagellar brake protein YcgR